MTKQELIEKYENRIKAIREQILVEKAGSDCKNTQDCIRRHYGRILEYEQFITDLKKLEAE